MEEGDLQDMLAKKAEELFTICDRECKGFITKRDMQRLKGELPLTPDQLEEVFDTLDDDRNGYLTLQEFTDGFGMFLGIETTPKKSSEVEIKPELEADQVMTEEADDEEQFMAMLENLGAQNLFKDQQDYVRTIWKHLHSAEQSDAVMMQFEAFIAKIVNDMNKSKTTCNDLEAALKTRSSLHEEEMQRMYDEMENQMKAEKERLIAEERSKEKKLRQELEDELHQKDQQLHMLISRQNQMEKQLETLNATESATKQQKQKMEKERDKLVRKLDESEKLIDAMQRNLLTLRRQQKDEHKERAKTAFKVTEGIAMEREGLVKQLDLLRNVNKQLRDEQDARDEPLTEDNTPETIRKGSILGPYFKISSESVCSEEPLKPMPKEPTIDEAGFLSANKETPPPPMLDESCEVDEVFYTALPRGGTDSLLQSTLPVDSSKLSSDYGSTPSDSPRSSSRNSPKILPSSPSSSHSHTSSSASPLARKSLLQASGVNPISQVLSAGRSDIHIRTVRKLSLTNTNDENDQIPNQLEHRRLTIPIIDISPDAQLQDRLGFVRTITTDSIQSQPTLMNGMDSESFSNAENTQRDELGNANQSHDNNNQNKASFEEDCKKRFCNPNSDLPLNTNQTKTDVPCRNATELVQSEDTLRHSEVQRALESNPHLQDTATTAEQPPNGELVNRTYGCRTKQIVKALSSDNFGLPIERVLPITAGTYPRMSTMHHHLKSRQNSTSDQQQTVPQPSDQQPPVTNEDSGRKAVEKAPLARHDSSPTSNRTKTSGQNPFESSDDEDDERAETSTWKIGRDADSLSQFSNASSASSPERIFKVVFVGDSGVGKSSFIHRFCHSSFKPSFSATIGVDFQVKTIEVNGHTVALQLWDTAGQERFRSITKQYYRKADGVIVMYDVTSELSFKSVRSWMEDVKEGSDEQTVVLLVGNKMDMSLNAEDRVIQTKDGNRLADDYASLFYETSAKTGDGVHQAMLGMSVLLQEREDEVIERALRLQEGISRKKCC